MEQAPYIGLEPKIRCAPASPRDWVTAHMAVRLGRLNRFDAIRCARRHAVSLVARRGLAAQAAFSSGISLFLPCWDADIQASVLAGRVFEPILTSLFRAILQSGEVVVDGGAHVGFYAVTAAKVMGRGTVIAFEPEPRNFALLRHNIRLNGMHSVIRAEPVALSGFDGETDMWVADDVSTSGSLVETRSRSYSCIRVRCACLDSYLECRQIRRVDLLKLDLEGAEPACLKGARKTLQITKSLVFELNASRLKAQGVAPRDVVKAFVACGDFREIFLLDETRNRAIEWAGGPDLESLLENTGFVNVFLSRKRERPVAYVPDAAHD